MTETAKKQIKLTHIQQLIGSRMVESKRSKPCFYMSIKADVCDMLGARPKLRKKLGVKITTNTFYIRALAIAVGKFPLMVASIKDGKIVVADSVNVGYAVSAPQGLIVPVLKNAQSKSLVEIATQEKELTNKARSNQLSLDEVTGETVGLSNLGAYDIDSFIGIVPPPATAIIAVGNILQAVGVKDNEPFATKMLSITLAADAKIITENYAAKFLSCFKDLLENPETMY